MLQQTVVLKLGGSVLTMPDLSARLAEVLHCLRPLPVLIIVGGGTTADLIRELDERYGCSPEKAHWDAIAAMTSNAMMLSRLDSMLQLVKTRDEALRTHAAGGVAVLDALAFLRSEERLELRNSLPASWDVTSDSIARWAALTWPAVRLILGKSCDPISQRVPELVQVGQIDPWFTHIRSQCSIEWLNVRSSRLEFIPLFSEIASTAMFRSAGLQQ